MSKLKNKVAVVTGASKGIGASIAKHFATEGAKVVVNYASSKESADKVVKEITDNGGIAISVQADVSKEADVTRLFEETKKAFGTLDILVNNAVFQQFLPIEHASAEAFHQHFNVNVLGPILTIQASLKLFGDKDGNIINISSGASKSPMAGVSLYSATKAALDAITISLSKELGAKNVRINSIFRVLQKQKVQLVQVLLLAVSMKKCLLPIRRLVAEVSRRILRKLPYFLLPMMRPGLRESKFPFRVVCMVFNTSYLRS
jgi:3-oxoacyl-[acyl-carrier protein] reductase